MPSCFVSGCKNSTKKRLPDVTYHVFPKNPEIRKKWVEVIGKENCVISKYAVICSAHFLEEHIDRTSSVCVRLREGAIPFILPAVPHAELRENGERNVLQQDSGAVDNTKLNHASCSQDQLECNLLSCSQTEPEHASEVPEIHEPRGQVRKLEEDVKHLRKKVKGLQQFKRRAIKKVASLKTVLKELKEKNFLDEDLCSMLGGISRTSTCLLKRQISKAKGHSLEKTYDPVLRAFSVTLNFLSPKAYEFVRDTFDTCLPHSRTLSKWYKTVEAEPGFCSEALHALQNMTEEKICALIFDFMSIRKHVDWSGTRWYGTVDNYDGQSDEAPLATEVLVYHLVCINGSWKVPVGYFLSNGMNASQLAELTQQCLCVLHSANVTVVSVTCDGAATHMTMAKLLGCNLYPRKLKTFFPHPDTDESVFFFFDACHMLKLVRNTLADLKELFNGDGESIKWQYIDALVTLQQEEGMHLANKLTKFHVEFQRQKMKVRLAAQTLSESVGDALRYCQRNKVPGFENCAATAEFVYMFNRLFDLLNSRSLYGRSFKQALNEDNIQEAKKAFAEAKEYILRLKNINGELLFQSGRKAGFLGFLVCIESTLSLYERVISKPLRYLPTYKMSQDHIERLFAYIRSHGGYNNNPTALQFRSAFKKILVHSQLYETRHGNAAPLDTISILCPIKKVSNTEEERKKFHCKLGRMSILFCADSDPVDLINRSLPSRRTIDSETDQHEQYTIMLPSSDDISFIVEDIVEYVAGYVVRSLKKRLNCLLCLETLEGHHVRHEGLISIKNRNALSIPSPDVVRICRIMEKLFRVRVREKTIPLVSTMKSMLPKVYEECITSNLFDDVNSHFLDQEPENNHFLWLLQAIALTYLQIRLYHKSKCINLDVHEKRIRQQCTKIIHFSGQ